MQRIRSFLSVSIPIEKALRILFWGLLISATVRTATTTGISIFTKVCIFASVVAAVVLYFMSTRKK